MIPTQAQADTFHTHAHHQLTLLTAAIYDLIDCGPTNHTPPPRPPTRRELAATERTDGHYQPTPRTAGRRTPGHRTDPVGRAVETWELEVQATVTRLYAIVTDLDHTLTSLGLTPTDGHGRPLDRPADPAVRRTDRGHIRINVGPRACRQATYRATGWIGAAIDAVTNRMTAVDDPDVGDHLHDRTRHLLRLLRVEVRRIDPPRPRLCACGCRKPAPPVGKGATRGACRERRSQQRRRDAS